MGVFRRPYAKGHFPHGITHPFLLEDGRTGSSREVGKNCNGGRRACSSPEEGGSFPTLEKGGNLHIEKGDCQGEQVPGRSFSKWWRTSFERKKKLVSLWGGGGKKKCTGLHPRSTLPFSLISFFWQKETNTTLCRGGDQQQRHLALAQRKRSLSGDTEAHPKPLNARSVVLGDLIAHSGKCPRLRKGKGIDSPGREDQRGM